MGHIKKYKQVYLSGLLIVGFILSGCQESGESRETIEKNGETTVIISNTDAIKPQKGAVKETLKIPQFVGYDFLSDDTLLGYKYSDSVFGDDRGLYKWAIEGKANGLGERLPFDKNPKIMKVSYDKRKLFFVPEKTSGAKEMTLYDFESSENLNFPMRLADYFWTFNWYADGGGGTLVSTKTNAYTYIRFDGKKTFKTYDIEPTLGTGETNAYLETNVFEREGKLYYWQYGKNEGLKAYDLKTKTQASVLNLKNVSQFNISKDEKWLAMTNYIEGGGNKLLLYDFKTHRTQELYASTFISNLTWDDSGNALAFTTVEKDGEVGVYYADLARGQSVYLGTYPGLGVKQMAFSPNGKRLMVTFLNTRTEETAWETQLLTIR